MNIENAKQDTLAELESQYEALKQDGLDLDLTRGKPNAEQVALADALDGILGGDYRAADGSDARSDGRRFIHLFLHNSDLTIDEGHSRDVNTLYVTPTSSKREECGSIHRCQSAPLWMRGRKECVRASVPPPPNITSFSIKSRRQALLPLPYIFPERKLERETSTIHRRQRAEANVFPS